MNGSTYTVPDGADVSYEVLCGYTLEYDDLPNINVGSLQDCMAACNDYVPAAPGDPYDQPCIAITYIGQNQNEGSCFRVRNFPLLLLIELTTGSIMPSMSTMSLVAVRTAIVLSEKTQSP